MNPYMNQMPPQAMGGMPPGLPQAMPQAMPMQGMPQGMPPQAMMPPQGMPPQAQSLDRMGMMAQALRRR